jgi:DNA-binding CsgD family transcriptional regulator
LLDVNIVRAELRRGQLEKNWVSFSTVALPSPRRQRANLIALPALDSSVPANAPGEVAPGQLLIEAPRVPELAHTLLGLIREDPFFAGISALLAVGITDVHCVRPNWGFNDFIICPYRPEELHRRLGAMTSRRERRRELAPNLADVSVNLGAHEVRVAGNPVALTHKEFALLRFLLESSGNVLSRQQLLDRVWGNDYDGSRRTVDTHVRRLRAKLGAGFPLRTVRGAGYRLAR